MIGLQSPDINRGIQNNGWGDQGVFVGYACRGVGMISRELYLARKINNALYNNARRSDNLGLDIKTQVTIDDNDEIDTVVVAIPMLHPVDLSEFIVKELGGRPKKLIINGTGVYQYHSSVADCGVTGRKLACDFYSVTCPIGGGAPWTKDATKADLTLNLYARQLAIESLHDNDECTVFLSSCIGLSELPSARICIVKDGQIQVQELALDLSPEELISKMDLRRPCFASMCRNGFIDIKHVSL